MWSYSKEVEEELKRHIAKEIFNVITWQGRQDKAGPERVIEQTNKCQIILVQQL